MPGRRIASLQMGMGTFIIREATAVAAFEPSRPATGLCRSNSMPEEPATEFQVEMAMDDSLSINEFRLRPLEKSRTGGMAQAGGGSRVS